MPAASWSSPRGHGCAGEMGWEWGALGEMAFRLSHRAQE